jgi:hypothetical protein
MKSPASRSEKKTDEEAREELQKPDMAAFDKVMRALIQVPHDQPKRHRQRKIKESG